MNKKLIILFLTILTLLSACSTKQETYEMYLINNGCTQVQIDVDGNTCNLNENGNSFDMGCTEMETTQKLDKLKCVEIKTPNTNCNILSGTMGEEGYFESSDAVICKNSGCEIEVGKYHYNGDTELDTGWYEFECIKK